MGNESSRKSPPALIDTASAIGAGKLADLAVFDRDLLACTDDELLTARVLFTIVGGRVAYEVKDR